MAFAIDYRDEDEDPSVREDKLDRALSSYVAELAAQAPGDIVFSTRKQQLRRDLLLLWPGLDEREEEAQNICAMIDEASQPLVADAQGVQISVHFSQLPVTVPQRIDESMTYLLFDMDGGLKRTAVLTPENRLKDALPSGRGISILSKPIYNHAPVIGDARPRSLKKTLQDFDAPIGMLQELRGQSDYTSREQEILASLSSMLRTLPQKLQRQEQARAANLALTPRHLEAETPPLMATTVLSPLPPPVRAFVHRLMHLAVDDRLSFDLRLGLRRLAQNLRDQYPAAMLDEAMQQMTLPPLFENAALEAEALVGGAGEQEQQGGSRRKLHDPQLKPTDMSAAERSEILQQEIEGEPLIFLNKEEAGEEEIPYDQRFPGGSPPPSGMHGLPFAAMAALQQVENKVAQQADKGYQPPVAHYAEPPVLPVAHYAEAHYAEPAKLPEAPQGDPLQWMKNDASLRDMWVAGRLPGQIAAILGMPVHHVMGRAAYLGLGPQPSISAQAENTGNAAHPYIAPTYEKEGPRYSPAGTGDHPLPADPGYESAHYVTQVYQPQARYAQTAAQATTAAPAPGAAPVQNLANIHYESQPDRPEARYAKPVFETPGLSATSTQATEIAPAAAPAAGGSSAPQPSTVDPHAITGGEPLPPHQTPAPAEQPPPTPLSNEAAHHLGEHSEPEPQTESSAPEPHAEARAGTDSGMSNRSFAEAETATPGPLHHAHIDIHAQQPAPAPASAAHHLAMDGAAPTFSPVGPHHVAQGLKPVSRPVDGQPAAQTHVNIFNHQPMPWPTSNPAAHPAAVTGVASHHFDSLNVRPTDFYATLALGGAPKPTPAAKAKNQKSAKLAPVKASGKTKQKLKSQPGAKPSAAQKAYHASLVATSFPTPSPFPVPGGSVKIKK